MATDTHVVERVLVVDAGGDRYGIPLGVVRRVLRDLRIVPVPGAPARLLGLAGFGGEPLAVLDLRSVLTGTDPLSSSPAVVVVVGTDGAEVLGLAVDHAAGVTIWEADDGHRVAAPEEDRPRQGMVDGVVGLLSLEKLGLVQQRSE